MGIMADRLDSLVITATSPDERFQAVYSEKDGLELRFRDGAYRHYTERGLERQLGQVANRLWTGYERGYYAALSDALGEPAERPRTFADAGQRRFTAERDETLIEGMSTGGYVYVCHTGCRNWCVVIRDGALAALDETGFSAEADSARHRMDRDCDIKTARLRVKHFASRIASHSRTPDSHPRKESLI